MRKPETCWRVVSAGAGAESGEGCQRRTRVLCQQLSLLRGRMASGGGQRAGASTAAGGARPCMARPWEQPGARADCPRGALPRNGRRRSCWRARVCVFQKKIKQPAPHPKASQKNSGQAARPHRGGRSDGLGARHALMMRRGNPAIASRVDSAARVARRKTSLGRQRGLPIASVRPLSRPARQMVCKTGIWPRVATNSSSWPPSSGVSLHRRQHLRHCHWSSVERARQTRRPERGGRCPAPCRGSPERGSTSLSEGRGRWPGWPAPAGLQRALRTGPAKTDYAYHR